MGPGSESEPSDHVKRVFKRARQAQLHLHQSADIRRRTQWNEVILGRKCSGRTAARVKCAPTPAVASSRRSWRASTFASLLRRLCEQNNSAAIRGGGIMLLQERLHRRWPLSVTFTELALLGHRRLAAVLGIARRPRQSRSTIKRSYLEVGVLFTRQHRYVETL